MPNSENQDSSSDRDLNQEKEFEEAVLRNFVEKYIEPELKRREAEGRWDSSRRLNAFQVLFRGALEENGASEIRINDECQIVARVRAKTKVDIGDPVTVNLSDFDGPGARIQLPKDQEINSAHFSAIFFGKGWVYGFDFEYDKDRKSKAVDHITVAQEFLDSAEENIDSGRDRVAVDNLYSAVELGARAVLVLELPAIARTHKFVMGNYSETRGQQLMKELSEIRPAARYLEGEFEIEHDVLKRLSTKVRELIEANQSVVNLNQNSLPVPTHQESDMRSHPRARAAAKRNK